MAELDSPAKDIFDGKLNAMDLCLLKRALLNPACLYELHRILRWSWFYERKYERLSGYRSGQVFWGISLELQSFRMPHFQYRIMPTTAPTTACKI